MTLASVLNFLHHISPAIFTVVVGAFIIQRFFVRRANDATYVDYLVRSLQELREDSLLYWMLPEKQDPQKSALLENKLKGHIKSINADLEAFKRRRPRSPDLETEMMEIVDACTGGTFETKGRSADPHRYILVTNSINRVRSALFGYKL